VHERFVAFVIKAESVSAAFYVWQ